ncbi:MAG: hypothetical protein ACJ798_19065 [Phenylobacterium sp.]
MTMPMTTMAALGRRTVLAMLIGAVGLAGGGGGPARASAADLVDVQVVDRETGETLQVWRRAGRAYVAGQPNARYALRVRNNSDGRVLVVMSVDGLNILTGETAGYGQTGYVLGPHESYDASGWRKSNSEVAAFTFAEQARSYAARTGRPADIGVIGVAAFREKVYGPSPVASSSRAGSGAQIDELVVTEQRPAAPRSAPAPLPVPTVEHRIEEPRPPAAARQADAATILAERKPEKLGTAHGAREWSTVVEVDFERATAYPQMIRRIEYDSYERLVANGVIQPPRPWSHPPRAFPGSDGPRYVPDPTGGR